MRTTQQALAALAAVLLLAATGCGGGDDGAGGGGESGTADTSTGGQAADGQAADGPTWSADVTGAIDTTIERSGGFTSYSRDDVDDTIVELTLVGPTVVTQVTVSFPVSILSGGTAELSEDPASGAPATLLTGGKSWTEDVSGTVTVAGMDADGSISGTFEFTALNGDDGSTVTVAGTFAGVPGD